MERPGLGIEATGQVVDKGKLLEGLRILDSATGQSDASRTTETTVTPKDLADELSTGEPSQGIVSADTMTTHLESSGVTPEMQAVANPSMLKSSDIHNRTGINPAKQEPQTSAEQTYLEGRRAANLRQDEADLAASEQTSAEQTYLEGRKAANLRQDEADLARSEQSTDADKPESDNDADDTVAPAEQSIASAEAKPQTEPPTEVVSEDEIPKDAIQVIKSKEGFMARTAKSFIGKLPLAGAFALLFAPQLAEAKGNPATEKLNREKRIELAASESTIKMLAPNHVTTENGKRVIKLNSQNSDRARTIYVDNHTSWAQRSADSVYESGSSQYHLFKTALEKVCPDRAMQKKIIQIMAGDYQEKYGNPSDPNSYTPKIGTTEAGAATVYQLTSDTAKHLSDIDKIASSLPKERYISLMNLCSDTISKGAEGAILLDLNSTRNNSDPNSTERAGTVYDSSENTAEANAGTVYDSSNENTASETNAGTVYDSPAENTPQK